MGKDIRQTSFLSECFKPMPSFTSISPRPDEVWRVTRPDEGVAQRAAPTVSSKVRVVE